MLYRLKLDRHVQHQIDRLPGHVRQRILRLLDALRGQPRPPEAKPLRGNHADKLQITLDVWRVVYRVDDVFVIVEVLKVGEKHGPEFYAGLETTE